MQLSTHIKSLFSIVHGQALIKSKTHVLLYGASGQSDIGFAGPEASIYVYNEGKEDYAVVFAQLTKRDGQFLMGRKAESDFKWSNLKGKYIIGGRKGGVPEMTLEYILRKNGLNPGKDVNVDTAVQFNLMAGAFTGGQGDYVTLFDSEVHQCNLQRSAMGRQPYSRGDCKGYQAIVP
ncbi:MAG: hypothetical protein K0R31_1367 [Clostridiales bacterium]|nr:hypothetical protein [Clostridiales bacterium]